jgi:hypothetical protein
MHIYIYIYLGRAEPYLKGEWGKGRVERDREREKQANNTNLHTTS